MNENNIRYNTRLDKAKAYHMTLYIENATHDKLIKLCHDFKMSKSDIVNGILKHLDNSEYFKIQRKQFIDSRLKELQKIETEAQSEARALTAELRKIQKEELV